jgi:hypothetical protein
MTAIDEAAEAKPKTRRNKVVPPEVFCERVRQKSGRRVEPAPEQVFKVRMAGVGESALALTADGVGALEIRYKAAMRELLAVLKELHDARGTPAVFVKRKVALARAEESFMRDVSDARGDIEGK